ncbi:MAG: hypothetical protein IKV77_06960 [Alistipes sp.]|nr:hypothetical protein [Alistipes sp.]
MKKLSLVVVLLTMAITTFAQEKDVTKFLGIPVDGTKTEMIAKLKEKGFTSSTLNKDVLEGEFNGYEVNVHVVTNNNKVYRIMVCDKNTMKVSSDIRIRFNKLCQQFQNNTKYITIQDYTISEDEDITYNIKVKDKRYEAVYYQADLVKIKEKLLEKYSEEEISNPNEEIQNVMFETIGNMCMHKPVWFMISEYYGEYYITMYYDNELNRANGDDL